MAQLTVPNTITAGTEILAAPLQNNFTAISSWANGGVGTTNIENGAITAPKIADNSVSTAKMQDRSVTMAKMEMKIASGRKSFSCGPVETYATPEVTFPVGMFSQPPVVVVSWGGWTDNTGGYSEERPIGVNPSSVTKDKFNAVYKNDASGLQTYKAFTWIAVGV